MLLKLGSKGEDVKTLQEKLGLTADGSFGPGTEKAVKEWQKKNGLKDDGVVGDTTWSKINLIKEEVVLDLSAPLSFVQKIKGHIPDAVFQQIPATCAAFNIITPLRLAHFLAQCDHESGGFKAVSENLNYGSEGLLGTFKSDFDTNHNRVLEANEKLKANTLSRKPEAIANFVYANQNGNGNEASGDGWKYRGRGFIQLTGRSNYEGFTKFIGEDCVANPDLVSTKYPLASAAFFFNKNKLWSICDLGSTNDVVTKVTKKVNGGTIGLDDRIKNFKEFYNLLK
jgi:putative chitinase